MQTENMLPPMIELDFKRKSENEMIEASDGFFHELNKRRSVREFSSDPVPRIVIENIIKAASTAPSGAHKQPWTFCVVSDTEIKKQIREAAEEEEQRNYNGRMSESWLEDLKAFRTNWQKPFLELAPYLIIVFKRPYEVGENGEKLQNYYVNESVGLATGMLLAAAHLAGLATLTHTPSPMNFLLKVLERPENERPFLLIPVGYPAEGCEVPALERKSLAQVLVEYS